MIAIAMAAQVIWIAHPLKWYSLSGWRPTPDAEDAGAHMILGVDLKEAARLMWVEDGWQILWLQALRSDGPESEEQPGLGRLALRGVDSRPFLHFPGNLEERKDTGVRSASGNHACRSAVQSMCTPQRGRTATRCLGNRRWRRPGTSSPDRRRSHSAP